MNERRAPMLLSCLLLSIVSGCGDGATGTMPQQGTIALAERATATRPLATTQRYVAIDAGGSATGRWSADAGYRMSGRSGVQIVPDAIDTSQVADAAPQAVYRTQRYATHLAYAISNLAANAAYHVRLHFVESYWHRAKSRLFSVTVGGRKVLDAFDVFRTAKASNRAIVRTVSTNADAGGTIAIGLDATVNNASIAGIEVIEATSAPTAYADANLPPPAWLFPFTSNPFTVAACAADPCAPQLDANSSSEVSAVMNGGALDLGDIYEGEPIDNDFPVYYSSAADPTYTVTCDSANGCGNGTVTVRIPDGAYASSGSDHHLAVVDVANGIESDFWEFNDHGTGTGTTEPVFHGGSLRSGSAGVCSATSFANNVNSCANSSLGSGMPVQPLVLDPREVLAGSIDHTLYVALGCAQRSFTFPASYSDGHCPAGPKYGQRLWLDLSDARIDALGDPAWATTMLHAMHRYGWTVGDYDGKSSGVAFANLSPVTFTLWNEPSPWATFWNGTGTNGYVALPTTGISQTNIHILAPCVNTQSC